MLYANEHKARMTLVYTNSWKLRKFPFKKVQDFGKDHFIWSKCPKISYRALEAVHREFELDLVFILRDAHTAQVLLNDGKKSKAKNVRISRQALAMAFSRQHPQTIPLCKAFKLDAELTKGRDLIAGQRPQLLHGLENVSNRTMRKFIATNDMEPPSSFTDEQYAALLQFMHKLTCKRCEQALQNASQFGRHLLEPVDFFQHCPRGRKRKANSSSQ